MLLKKVKHRFTRFFDNLKDMEDLLGFFSPGVSSFSFRSRSLTTSEAETMDTPGQKKPSRLDRTIQDGTGHFYSPNGLVFSKILIYRFQYQYIVGSKKSNF